MCNFKFLGWRDESGEEGSDGQLEGGKERRADGGGGGGGRCIVQQKLPMLASQCGYVMRARDTDTHTHSRTHRHTLGAEHGPTAD